MVRFDTEQRLLSPSDQLDGLPRSMSTARDAARRVVKVTQEELALRVRAAAAIGSAETYERLLDTIPQSETDEKKDKEIGLRHGSVTGVPFIHPDPTEEDPTSVLSLFVSSDGKIYDYGHNIYSDKNTDKPALVGPLREVDGLEQQELAQSAFRGIGKAVSENHIAEAILGQSRVKKTNIYEFRHTLNSAIIKINEQAESSLKLSGRIFQTPKK